MAQNPSGIIKAERKLLLVPLVFIILRIWDIAGDIFIVYRHHHVYDNGRNWIKLFTVSLPHITAWRFLMKSPNLILPITHICT